MRSRSLSALVLTLGACLLVFAGLDTVKPADEEPPRPRKAEIVPPRVLPGLLADGFVQLPNQWRLRPVGKQIEVGNFPINSAVHPSGQYLAVLHAGWQDHEVAIIDLNRAGRRSSVGFPSIRPFTDSVSRPTVGDFMPAAGNTRSSMNSNSIAACWRISGSST